MGGVVSVSEKSSVCKDRIKLAILARQQQEAFAKAQKNYHKLQDKMGTTFYEFVSIYCSLPIHVTIHDKEKKDHDEKDSSIVTEQAETPKDEGHHDEKDSSITTEKAETCKNEDLKTTKEKPGRGNKKQNTKMVAKKAETSAKKEDNNVGHRPEALENTKMVAEKAETSAKKEDNIVGHSPEAPEKIRLSEALRKLKKVVHQFEDVDKSGSDVCKLLETNEIVKEHKSTFPWSRSTTSKIVSRSRSSKVGDDYEEKAKAAKLSSTLQNLYFREEHLSRLVEIVEDVKKKGETTQVSEESAVEALNKIRKFRDDELRPQLSNLLEGLQKIWTNMSKYHRKQNEIMSEKSLYQPHEMCCDALHSIATKELQTQLQNWFTAFTSYISSQKAYIKSLHDLSKHSVPSFFEKEVNDNGCTKLLGDWLTCLEKLEDKEVSKAISECNKEVKKLKDQQKKERECKSKVEKLNEDICKLVKQTETSSTKKKKKKETELNRLTNALKNEERAYQTSKTNTQKIAINVIQERFASVFKSLAEFTTKAAKEYAEVAKNHNINCSD
ncbi:protein ROLLING AND ERECT LEAF 2-like [Rosa rugosa]|uniref:protein ROLLING AND ERECT LEAF 2-like n=1 Tax=Rosa rugosa TaxID=74645 RepID=UPI002B40FF65|nr:protein ROLLING AND ERECT LEAF 2-like [Rosa rugosa]